MFLFKWILVFAFATTIYAEPTIVDFQTPVELGDLLGYGSYGLSFLTKETPPNVVKIMIKSKEDPSVSSIEDNAEVQMLRKLGDFLDAAWFDGHLAIKMKYFDGYNLSYWEKTPELLSMRHSYGFRDAAIKELKRLHDMGITHGDIHGSNILFKVERKGNQRRIVAKLIDFGQAKDWGLDAATCKSKSCQDAFENDEASLDDLFNRLSWKLHSKDKQPKHHLGSADKPSEPSVQEKGAAEVAPSSEAK